MICRKGKIPSKKEGICGLMHSHSPQPLQDELQGDGAHRSAPQEESSRFVIVSRNKVRFLDCVLLGGTRSLRTSEMGKAGVLYRRQRGV